MSNTQTTLTQKLNIIAKVLSQLAGIRFVEPSYSFAIHSSIILFIHVLSINYADKSISFKFSSTFAISGEFRRHEQFSILQPVPQHSGQERDRARRGQYCHVRDKSW